MFSLIFLWQKAQLTPAELHFEETKTSKPQPKKRSSHKYQEGPSLIFSSMFPGFLNNPEVFFCRRKRKAEMRLSMEMSVEEKVPGLIQKKKRRWREEGEGGGVVGFWNWTPFLIECEIETELSTRTTRWLLDHTSIYRGRWSYPYKRFSIWLSGP